MGKELYHFGNWILPIRVSYFEYFLRVFYVIILLNVSNKRCKMMLSYIKSL